MEVELVIGTFWSGRRTNQNHNADLRKNQLFRKSTWCSTPPLSEPTTCNLEQRTGLAWWQLQPSSP